MRNRRAYWGLVGVGFGFFTLSVTGSTPTFSFKLAGINGEMFRDTACATDEQCPDGSSCALTEMTFPGNFELRCAPIAEVRLRCVGGTTPGQRCNTIDDCGGLGQCRGLVEPGDDMILEAYLSGWDVDPDMGICNNGDECTLALNDCTQKHCSLSGQLCSTADCAGGQSCDADECSVGPLLGAYQWTLDCRSFASITVPYAGRLMHTVLPCEVEEDCWHGYSFISQCTCVRSRCENGVCSVDSTAYFELTNFDYIYRYISHEKLIRTNTCNYAFAGAASRGGKADEQEEKYVGTMWLTVPMDAYGTYEVNFVDDINATFVNDASAHRYPPPNLEPLVLEFPDPCIGYVCPPSEIACYEYVCRMVAGERACIRSDICAENSHSHCDPETGRCVWDYGRACCFSDGSCAFMSSLQCEASGGVWRPDAPACEANLCGPVGACCHDAVCSMEWWEDCVGQGGDYLGDGVPCEEGTCPRAGACCVLGYCSAGTELGCRLIGGRYLGYGVPCDPDPCADVTLVNSVPPHEGSLWRSRKNIVRISFDGDLPSTPAPGQVEIVKLLPDGAFGPDLSASFTFDVEDGKVLRIQDTGATLQHRKWYAIRNVGNWPGVAPFEIHYVVQMGDCDGNGIVISLDVGCVNAGIPCFIYCGDDNRKDMDGDDRVLSLDVGAVNAHIGSFTVPKPTGH